MVDMGFVLWKDLRKKDKDNSGFDGFHPQFAHNAALLFQHFAPIFTQSCDVAEFLHPETRTN
jgi:hypothetical protein